MRVLSLFDGISVARLALDRIGITPTAYYASEIDKRAIAVSGANWPDIIQLGDVCGVTADQVGQIELMIFGSPCTDLSSMNAIHGKKLGLDGERSGLFFEALRLIREVKPTYFVMENVASMSNKSKDDISELMGVEPIKINSALVSAQNRNRYYWSNIEIQQPEDRGITLDSILQPLEEIDGIYSEPWRMRSMNDVGFKDMRWFEHTRSDTAKGKSSCVTTASGPSNTCIIDRRFGLPIYRKMTPIEFEVARQLHRESC